MPEIYVKLNNQNGKYFTTINNAVRYLSSPRTPPALPPARPQPTGIRHISNKEQKRLVGILNRFLKKY